MHALMSGLLALALPFVAGGHSVEPAVADASRLVAAPSFGQINYELSGGWSTVGIGPRVAAIGNRRLDSVVSLSLDERPALDICGSLLEEARGDAEVDSVSPVVKHGSDCALFAVLKANPADGRPDPTALFVETRTMAVKGSLTIVMMVTSPLASTKESAYEAIGILRSVYVNTDFDYRKRT